METRHHPFPFPVPFSWCEILNMKVNENILNVGNKAKQPEKDVKNARYSQAVSKNTPVDKPNG